MPPQGTAATVIIVPPLPQLHHGQYTQDLRFIMSLKVWASMSEIAVHAFHIRVHSAEGGAGTRVYKLVP
jgi:hypothetical protein